MTKQLLSEIAKQAQEFVSGRRSLTLSTVNASGEPLASYAPFFRSDNGDFYIFVSTLATHTANLDEQVVSIMIIEDEAQSQQIYARQRLYFQCNSSKTPRDSKDFGTALEGLKLHHGEIIDTLERLADFTMYRLTPCTGRYIRGFGQAYKIDPLLGQVMHLENP